MKVFAWPKGEGKTSVLIEMAKSYPGVCYIVVHDQREVARVFEQAHREIRLPITYAEFLERRFSGKNIDAFLIDNVDTLLGMFAGGVAIEAVTLTVDGEDDKSTD